MSRSPQHLTVPPAVYDALLQAKADQQPLPSLLYPTGTERNVSHRGYRIAYEWASDNGKWLIGKNIYPRSLPVAHQILTLKARGRPDVAIEVGRLEVAEQGAPGLRIRGSILDGKWVWVIPIVSLETEIEPLKKEAKRLGLSTDRLCRAYESAQTDYYDHKNQLGRRWQFIEALGGKA